MTTKPRFLFLVNDAAGRGGAVRRLSHALRAAPGIAKQSRQVVVTGLADIVAALRDLDASTLPVAAGGDGTAHLVVRALLHIGLLDRPFGVFPLGTANALAHEVGASTQRRAFQILAAGRVALRDVILTSNPSCPLALISLSTGFEGRFIRWYQAGRHRSRTRAVLAAAAHSLATRRARITLVTDGVLASDADALVYNAGLYNTRSYGFGPDVFPDADPADGLGEALICRSGPAYWAGLIRGVRRSRLPRGAALRSWQTASLSTDQLIQIDGELAPGGTFDVRIAPAALRVVSL